MSGRRRGEEYNLAAVMGDDPTGGGVADGAVLLELAEAVVDPDPERLAVARERGLEALGSAGLVDAAAVLASFAGINRVASGTGIPLDAVVEKHSRDFRVEIGIEAFRKAD